MNDQMRYISNKIRKPTEIVFENGQKVKIVYGKDGKPYLEVTTITKETEIKKKASPINTKGSNEKY